MVQISVLLLGLSAVGGVFSLPSTPKLEITTVKALSTYVKRQETQPWDFTCLKTGAGKSNDIVRARAENMARYLESVAAAGRTCGLDRSRDYFNLITMDGFQANIYFTNRVPQLQSAEFNCNELAAEVRKIASICTGSGTGLVIGYEWLLNCKAIRTTGNIPQPYVEGGTGIEIREVGYTADNHKG